MYCQSCGSQINAELNYCNRCGNRVGGNELATLDGGDARLSVLKSLSIATGFVGVVGVGGLIGLIAILINSGVRGPDLVFLALLFAATVFGICFLLTRQISRFSENGIVSPKQNLKQKRAPEQLNAADAATEFQPAHKHFRSVTENTTRTLDKNNV